MTNKFTRVGSRLVAKWRGRGCDYGRRRVVATTARTDREASVPSFAIDGAGSDRLRKAVYLEHFLSASAGLSG